ncbi:hypothetical protein [Actinophytocola oryzae]|uniref:Uncharacterized protein n=1 Tax=Actinophytocola oryzae TaxID=502181 RepID=A0A4R7VRF0_9PSEU|nr:hypothetical protein [Actinophytocola oryzae]TDV52373.1 hypothetical protein CLV71_105505 [Actinophytocola oryzae]
MTEDITRRLAMLADEAEPAQIDPHDVITRAKAQTRNRRATIAAAVATLALVSALVTTVGNPLGKPAAPTGPEDATLSDHLDRQLRESLPETLPSDWSIAPRDALSDTPLLTFLCVLGVSDGVDRCVASATYRDGTGRIDIVWNVAMGAKNFDDRCAPEYCTDWTSPVLKRLPDRTETKLTVYTETMTSRDIEELLVSRPDGTQITVNAIWPKGERSKPPLTTERILKFATVFTYDTTLPVGNTFGTSTTPYVTDDPNRAERVQGQLNDVLPKVIPAGWSPSHEGDEEDQPPLTMGCTKFDSTPSDAPESCSTYSNYRDGTGRVGISFEVSKSPLWYNAACDPADCVATTLEDGTDTKVWIRTQPDSTGAYHHELAAVRPDGTCVSVRVSWTGQRPETPLTTENLLKFSTAFTY